MKLSMLKELCETPGVPGREERVRAVIRKYIEGIFDTVEEDPLGSLICTKKPNKAAGSKQKSPTRVMIAAHMDEIGFYVRHIDEKGFLWLNPAGGFDARNLFSRRVLVCSENDDFTGVMNPGGKPIHISTNEERNKVPEVGEFFVDLGMKADDVRKKVQIGDFVVMHEPFLEQPLKVVSKALDNRIACFVAIEAMQKLGAAKAAAGQHACEIVVVFTTQEEVGLRGASTAAYAVNADIGIGLDTTLAVDTPGVSENQRVTVHGEGVGIMVQDSSMIADYKLCADLCAVATTKKIPYQRCVLPRGGQDAAAIQRAGNGARTAAVVCGTRYIHTVTESIDKKDLQATIDLLAAWLPSIA
jgi:endoglucanase